MVNGCINSAGSPVYSVGVYTGGISVFTEEIFHMYLDMVTDVADKEIAHLYKKTIELSNDEAKVKKRGLLSILKKIK